MEFGKHIGKGMWGLAGRALPSVYGVGIIVFVIRIFPPVEFGVYTLLQTIFLLAVAMSQSFALQPLVKFGAETDRLSGPVSAAAFLYLLFVLPVAALIFLFGGTLGGLFRSETAGELMYLVALMLVASVPRNVASYLLQSKLQLKRLFFLDAIYSLGSLALIAVLVPTGRVTTAAEIVLINLGTITCSSLYGLSILFGTYRVRPELSRESVRAFWAYGKFSLGASISYTLYAQSDNLIISAIMGPVSLAVYNAAKVFTRGYELMLQLITTLLVPTASRLDLPGKDPEKLALAQKSFFVFTTVMAALSAGLFFAGPILIDVIYAGKYPGSAGVLYILAISGIFIPAISIGSSFCFALGKMKEVFLVNLSMASLGILALLCGTLWYGMPGTAWGVVCTYATMAVVWTAVLRRRAGIPLDAKGVLARHSDATNFVRRILLEKL